MLRMAAFPQSPVSNRSCHILRSGPPLVIPSPGGPDASVRPAGLRRPGQRAQGKATRQAPSRRGRCSRRTARREYVQPAMPRGGVNCPAFGCTAPRARCRSDKAAWNPLTGRHLRARQRTGHLHIFMSPKDGCQNGCQERRQSAQSLAPRPECLPSLPLGAPLSSTACIQAEVQHASAGSILITDRFGIVIGPDDFLCGLIGDQEVLVVETGTCFTAVADNAVAGDIWLSDRSRVSLAGATIIGPRRQLLEPRRLPPSLRQSAAASQEAMDNACR